MNEFLPSAMPNLGPLDLMHRLVLRLSRVQQSLIWEDGSVRQAALELEAASRPFARDLQVRPKGGMQRGTWKSWRLQVVWLAAARYG